MNVARRGVAQNQSFRRPRVSLLVRSIRINAPRVLQWSIGREWNRALCGQRDHADIIERQGFCRKMAALDLHPADT